MRLTALFLKAVTPSGRVPVGWRLAWHEPKQQTSVYGLVPLHWALRWGRELGYRLRTFIRAPRIEQVQRQEMQERNEERQRLADEYSRGYLAGWHACFEACLTTVEEEFDNREETWEVGELLVGCLPGREN